MWLSCVCSGALSSPSACSCSACTWPATWRGSPSTPLLRPSRGALLLLDRLFTVGFYHDDQGYGGYCCAGCAAVWGGWASCGWAGDLRPARVHLLQPTGPAPACQHAQQSGQRGGESFVFANPMLQNRDPVSEFFPSRIRIKEFKNLIPYLGSQKGTGSQIRIRNTAPNSGVVDRHRFYAFPDPDLTSHFDADPYPTLSFIVLYLLQNHKFFYSQKCQVTFSSTS